MKISADGIVLGCYLVAGGLAIGYCVHSVKKSNAERKAFEEHKEKALKDRNFSNEEDNLLGKIEQKFSKETLKKIIDILENKRGLIDKTHDKKVFDTRLKDYDGFCEMLKTVKGNIAEAKTDAEYDRLMEERKIKLEQAKVLARIAEHQQLREEQKEDLDKAINAANKIDLYLNRNI